MTDRLFARAAGAAVVIACLGGIARAAEGIATDFGNVTLNNIPQGTPFTLAQRPVRVTNHGGEPVDVQFEAATPEASRLLPGYEAVPDLGWVSFKPGRVNGIKPDATEGSVLTLSVPAGAAYAGRKFQVDLFLHTTGAGVHAVSMGLKPRLCFAVAPAGVAVETGRQAEIAAELTPAESVATGGQLWVPAKPLHVANRSRKDLTFRLGTGSVGPVVAPSTTGYEPLPAEATVVCNPRTLTLAKGEEADVEVGVLFPLDPRYAGKKYQVLVPTEAEQKGRVLHLVNKVLLEVSAWPTSSAKSDLKP